MNKSFWKETFETIVFVLVAVIIIRFFIGEIRWIPSGSMHPTLLEGDRVFVERISGFFKSPQRGDIMVFYPPQEQLKVTPGAVFSRLTGFFCKDIAYIKRVIGLPGEKINIIQNNDGSFDVLINDEKINEPYIVDRFEYPVCTEDMTCGPVVLGDDEYFMMGDNRGHSSDSRFWGPLKRNRFIGRAKVLFWPFNRFDYFEIKNYEIKKADN